MTISERLERLEESHVKLMTEHEVAWAQHEKFREQQDIEWDRQQKRWAQNELDRKAERERGADLDRRISDLVSAIGEYIRKGR